MGATGRRNFFERYEPVRRPVEVGFWVLVLALQAMLNTAVALIDARAAARPPAPWQVVSWELSSHLVLLALVPALAAFERRFPLYRPLGWLHTLGAHLAGSVLFCVLHVGGMVLLRKAVAALAGGAYDFGGGGSWLYEYLKDVRSYVMIVAGIACYRFLLLRLQGEARVLDAPEPAGEGALPATPAPAVAEAEAEAETHAPEPVPPPVPAPPAAAARPERFLVRKLRREFLIAAGDIDWLQAQGNYVGLHVNGHDYLLRATLTDFLAQLDPARFVRVHRSHAVNLDRIREIEPTDGGDARLHMHDGSVVPCSRRHRDALTSVPG